MTNTSEIVGGRFPNPFDLPELAFDEAFFRDPHTPLTSIREAGHTAAFLPRMGTTMFLSYRQVHDILLDRNFGAMGSAYYEQQGWNSGPYIDWVRQTVVFLDPPIHDRLRSLVNRAFTPRQVDRVRPITEQIASRLADEAASQEQVDLYDCFAQKLPLQVICEVIGIPEVDFDRMGRWTAALSVATAYPSPYAREAADAAMIGLSDYAGDLIRDRRAAPAEDLLSALIAVEEAGERLTAE